MWTPPRSLWSYVLCLLPALALPAWAQTPGPISNDGSYVIIGWNDLGMHCINPRFKDVCLLPPANFLHAVVIRRGDDPALVSAGVSISYTMPTNRQPELRTNFWRFAKPLFGLDLAPGVGLTGNATHGQMAVNGDQFVATAVPAVPHDTTTGEFDPFPHAVLRLRNTAGTVLAKTTIVVPVSDEMNCAKCHVSGGVAAPGINNPRVEQNILQLHDQRQGTTLMSQRPVLCSKCHADAALNEAGTPGVPALSYSMHTKHASVAQKPGCYDCHPGANTQCNRSAITRMGPAQNGKPGCSKCHGNLEAMAAGLQAGRQPWAEEPTCAQCHGAAYSTGTTLYREARGHGNVPCIACHNSPHAWYPSQMAEDNVQPTLLQNSDKALGFQGCHICHTDGRNGDMPPHGGDGGD